MSDYVSPAPNPTASKRRLFVTFALVSACAVIAGVSAGVAYGRSTAGSAGTPEAPAAETEECVPILLNVPPMVTRAPGEEPQITRITRLPNGEWPKGDGNAVVRDAMPRVVKGCPSTDDGDGDGDHTPGPSLPGVTVIPSATRGK